MHWTSTDLTPAWRPDAGTIVFTHGVGTTSDVWAEWLPLLADRYRLVRFDTRGFGRSPAPPSVKWSLDIDRDGIIHWCNRENAAGYAVFPSEKQLLPAAERLGSL